MGKKDQFSELNSQHYLDPDKDDFGAALNEAIAKADAGGTIIVPPVEYTGPHTPVTVTKPFLTIRSDSVNGRDQYYQASPRIVDSAGMSGPFITSHEFISIKGLAFVKTSGTTDSAAAIKTHKTCVIDGIAGSRINGPLIYLRSDGTTGTDNVNNSSVTNISGHYIRNDVVQISRADGAARNLNGVRVHVLTAKDCDGYGINFGESSFGNHGVVDHAAGGTGAIRFAGLRSYGEVMYAGDGLSKVFQFDGPRNGSKIIHKGGNTTLENGLGSNPDNRIERAYPVTGEADMVNPGVPYTYDNSIALQQGQGVQFTSANGTDWLLRINNEGNPITTQL